LIRLAVRCRPEQAGLVLAELSALAPNGFEEEHGDGYVEYAIYGGEGELPDLGRMEALAGEGAIEIDSIEVPDDWADRWQDFHKPVLVGGRIWIRPSWAEPDPTALDVVVDPGRAFGTGAHATTRMCVEYLVDLAEAGAVSGALCDLGTGSGVLAICAAKLGWNPVAGYDHEPASLEAAAENAARNGVELELGRLNLRQELPPLAPTSIANLTAPLLRGIATALEGTRPPERLVCSGMLAAEVDHLSAAFDRAGLQVQDQRRDGDWAAMSLARR
jgi:ribosomal protein L11 methyltransferase